MKYINVNYRNLQQRFYESYQLQCIYFHRISEIQLHY
ncbi:unnamed protein product (macronuclear) [Paramecium tetraurelia]|uniref:Uncharacterized protein n=1 Tax=Paramecium tetraurelia TaxID=5888 RepID=A0DSF2_PARTE|nr:uncharacterized protein GSPATT00019673001 [Paramecium tetraurelia]CAK85969.1 unnamed protein product [Paramecium tetraurelia]